LAIFVTPPPAAEILAEDRARGTVVEIGKDAPLALPAPPLVSVTVRVDGAPPSGMPPSSAV
jgi:hypothetical protein